MAGHMASMAKKQRGTNKCINVFTFSSLSPPLYSPGSLLMEGCHPLWTGLPTFSTTISESSLAQDDRRLNSGSLACNCFLFQGCRAQF